MCVLVCVSERVHICIWVYVCVWWEELVIKLNLFRAFIRQTSGFTNTATAAVIIATLYHGVKESEKDRVRDKGEDTEEQHTRAAVTSVCSSNEGVVFVEEMNLGLWVVEATAAAWRPAVIGDSNKVLNFDRKRSRGFHQTFSDASTFFVSEYRLHARTQARSLCV